MVLSPLDIHNKEFKRAFKGFQEDEVNEFLEQVMKDFELLIKQNRNYEKELKEKNDRISHFESIEETMNQSILVAQNAAKDIKENANKEADLIVQEAEKNANRIVNEALAQSREISSEIEDLKKRAKILRARLKLLIQSQLEMVEHDDWDFLIDEAEEDVIKAQEIKVDHDSLEAKNAAEQINETKQAEKVSLSKEAVRKLQDKINANISNPIEDDGDVDSVTAQVNYSFTNINFDENLVDQNEDEQVELAEAKTER